MKRLRWCYARYDPTCCARSTASVDACRPAVTTQQCWQVLRLHTAVEQDINLANGMMASSVQSPEHDSNTFAAGQAIAVVPEFKMIQYGMLRIGV